MVYERPVIYQETMDKHYACDQYQRINKYFGV